MNIINKDNKKLAVTLVASFVIIALLTGIVGFISTDITKNSINQLVGKQSTGIAKSALDKIDVAIVNKITELRELGNDPNIQKILTESMINKNGIINNDISTKIQEKKLFYEEQTGYPIYTKILLTDVSGNKIADTESENNENFSEQQWWIQAKEYYTNIEDVSYNEEYYWYDIGISVRINDKQGNFIGVIHADYNFEDIMRIIDESQYDSQFQTLEFDLFDQNEILIYSTIQYEEEVSMSDFIPVLPPESQYELDKEIQRLERLRENTMSEYGIYDTELTYEQSVELDSKLAKLDQEYDAMFEAFDYESTTDKERENFDAEIERIDRQYDATLNEYGITYPSITNTESVEIESKLQSIDEQLDALYEKYNYDFTFGINGFAILQSDDEREILHSYSRQMGYYEFPGLGWTLITHTDMDEILSDVNSQRESQLIIIFSITAIATVLGVYFARIFYKQSRKLNENEKMSTIGHLSSNIAHDLRNPLGTIRSSVERISDQNNDENKKVSQEIDRIKRSVNRMSHQIEGVLNYVKTTPLILDNNSIKEMIIYATESMNIPSNIKVELPDNDFDIECDREKMEITFVNLILNSIQAIDEKNDGLIRIKIMDKTKYILIEFENSGPPILQENLGKIFDPLFTTKLKGTGLGLSSCKNIISQHKGAIFAAPDPVIFTVRLPKKQKSSKN